MAKRSGIKKKEVKEPMEEKAQVEKEVSEVEEQLEVKSSESESESDIENDIEGLSDNEAVSEDSKHKIKKLDPKKRAAKNKQGNTKDDEYSSIIYVSRLPNGFHEKELSKYFSQFGDLKEARLARNKKSGNSRHYGFVEFANKEDAKVAQETMDNYLLMGHLLRVRLMGKGSKIEKLFKYRKRAFIEPQVKKDVNELKEKAEAKHEERVAKLAKAGIDFKW
ncbi:hypothetical protein KAFR_0B04540 [Kazachstania africana CBS 2517]|uniref:RRM domain-containing protein n=1 Tax=Kazachstania africana (strain ATCC 22294 / BCRC 22015 / CBS 2517 / CECT 1963 / NBRC 1671 / NRRL Y-8276) TaxID=1071382 RepID=H2AQV1_KAZAF|nr:hypothetical protein KAFR_0B04540 [Kazachstania africana CBS 2517]CCF56751.1 hypothetical protein KAFR_0B04540 [Kazachstania africana CBS 2517]